MAAVFRGGVNIGLGLGSALSKLCRMRQIGVERSATNRIRQIDDQRRCRHRQIASACRADPKVVVQGHDNSDAAQRIITVSSGHLDKRGS